MATASNSLFNMTVASDNAGGNQGLLMPKLQYRFRVNFLNFGVDVDGACIWNPFLKLSVKYSLKLVILYLWIFDFI